MLHDRGARMVNALRIRNREHRRGDRAYGVPHPGVLYVDASGTIALKFAKRGYKIRPTFTEIYTGVTEYIAAETSAPNPSSR